MTRNMTATGRVEGSVQGKIRASLKTAAATAKDKSLKKANGVLKSKEERTERTEMELPARLVLLFMKIFMVLYDVITFPIYFIFQQPWKKWKANRTIWAKTVRENDPYSPYVRVNQGGSNMLEGINTMEEMFRLAVAKHGDKPCFGVREVLAEAEEYYKTGKIFRKLRLGDYHWYSYNDVESRVEQLSKGMLALGLQPKRQIVIFAETRIEWMLTCQACFKLNVPVVTLYATLGEDGIIHGINETEVTYLFTSQELLPKLKKLIHKLPGITHIIYMENLRPADTNGFPERCTIIPFSQVEAMGATCDTVSKPDPPGPNDLAILMYTSGSTGVPKGVLLTHKNMVVTAGGLQDAVPGINETGDNVYIAYLPLAHTYEISAECFFLVMGIAVGYSSPHTLTDKSTAIMAGCKGDASLLKPTILTSVPLMLDRIRKSVRDVSTSKGPFATAFFNFAVRYKQFWWEKGFDTPILTRLVFKKIKDLVGGRVRIIACGGAPLSPDTQEFVRTCMDVKLIQAYGMTETAASATVQSLTDYSTGCVGAPLSSCYIKLVDWVEGGYRATDKPHSRGEIVIGGDCVTLGYYKREELTNEYFKEEDGVRWFYTGDIAELLPNGTLKIIDRKKDLVKLVFGEYVSLGKIEAELKTCLLVDNICVIGNSFHDHLVALIVPNMEKLKTLAADMGKEDLAINELCQDQQIIDAVTKEIISHGQKSRLAKTEIPTKVKLCHEEWQPESGLVTAAFKIRRVMIHQYYKKAIDEMYNISELNTSKTT